MGFPLVAFFLLGLLSWFIFFLQVSVIPKLPCLYRNNFISRIESFLPSEVEKLQATRPLVNGGVLRLESKCTTSRWKY